MLCGFNRSTTPQLPAPSALFLDEGMECTHNKFADNTELSGAVNTLEGRDAIQGDLDRLERWVPTNLIKFSKAKCKTVAIPSTETHWRMALEL